MSIQEAKVKLNLAIRPGTWLMPFNMFPNTEAKTAYNNFLKYASPSMQLGLTSDVNKQTKTVGIIHNLGVQCRSWAKIFGGTQLGRASEI